MLGWQASKRPPELPKKNSAGAHFTGRVIRKRRKFAHIMRVSQNEGVPFWCPPIHGNSYNPSLRFWGRLLTGNCAASERQGLGLGSLDFYTLRLGLTGA